MCYYYYYYYYHHYYLYYLKSNSAFKINATYCLFSLYFRDSICQRILTYNDYFINPSPKQAKPNEVGALGFQQ